MQVIIIHCKLILTPILCGQCMLFVEYASCGEVDLVGGQAGRQMEKKCVLRHASTRARWSSRPSHLGAEVTRRLKDQHNQCCQPNHGSSQDERDSSEELADERIRLLGTKRRNRETASELVAGTIRDTR
jgi:hypothetical protein